MVNDVTLGAALRSTLTSINRTQDTIDVVTKRLASGLDVNSAVDDPQNFFLSKSLKNEASDKARLLDDIGQSVRVIQESITGLEATAQLIDQGEAIVQESLNNLQLGIEDDAIFEVIGNSSPTPLDAQIIAGTPDVYFRLDETGGAIVDSGFGAAGPVGANYNSGASAGAADLYTNGGAPSVDFDGVNDRIRVNDSTMINTSTTPARTVEMVFNADDVSGRQVLYEEGATVNGLTIYIDNGLLRVEAEDDQGGNRFGNLDISTPIIAGETYHVAFVFNGSAGPADGGAGPSTFAGYLNGVQFGFAGITADTVFPSHSGDIGIGGVNGGVQFHDGENNTGNGFNFDGRISNVAIYNRALTNGELLDRGTSLNASTVSQFQNKDFNNVLDQLDQIVVDANYRGVNLLDGEELRTDFNSERTSSLITEGQKFSSADLGIQRADFREEDQLNNILNQLRAAKTKVEAFSFTLSNNISIIQIRNTFTQESIITLERGADDLVVADQNEEGANLLASQTRLQLGFASLSIASQAQNSVIDLIGTSEDG